VRGIDIHPANRITKLSAAITVQDWKAARTAHHLSRSFMAGWRIGAGNFVILPGSQCIVWRFALVDFGASAVFNDSAENTCLAFHQEPISARRRIGRYACS
jgi:hypothetical protein